MPKIQNKSRPGIVGAVICTLLIVSYSLSYMPELTAVKTILQIVSICLCVHLIRSTAKLYGVHVWHVKSLITLWCMPVINLGTMAVVFLKISTPLLNTFLARLILVAFSLPLFFLYYYIYLCRKFIDSRSVKTITVLLVITCAVYSVIQLFDKGILPMLIRMNIEVNDSLDRFMNHSSEAAFIVYLVAFVGFILFQIHVNRYGTLAKSQVNILVDEETNNENPEIPTEAEA